ncbi:HXXEE domain-containing protein [Halomonas sp. GXIMD04776]|uniref:HXXEE domain-containing protein n=1 Tax=Halomonas sp. GXIMD04776 TaxID=3415605 RepID=UPI003CBC7ECE
MMEERKSNARILISNTMLILIWASVAAFALHNIEEAVHIESWAQASMPANIAQYYKTVPYLLAVALLWMTYLVCAVWALKAGTSLAMGAFAIGVAAITANALVHIIANLILRQEMPGFWSATFLILPFGVSMAWLALKNVYLARILHRAGQQRPDSEGAGRCRAQASNLMVF